MRRGKGVPKTPEDAVSYVKNGVYRVANNLWPFSSLLFFPLRPSAPLLDPLTLDT
jgi:hypothetical protein